MPFRFRPPTPDDAAILLDWRTRPDVTRFMFTDIENPSVEAQRAWLAAVSAREDLRHFVIEVAAENRPIGYLSFTDIDRSRRRCSSGLYIGEADDRRRYAGFLPRFIFDYCFHVLDMDVFVNAYMEGNARLIRSQSLLGYREVGVLKRHVWKYDRWHDVHLLELRRDESEALPRPFPLEHTLAAFGIDAASLPVTAARDERPPA